jgi:phospholipid/cholesterol/gamma-HCH transport system substrate-binding protein
VTARTAVSRLRLQAYGVVYLAIVLALIWFSVAAYNHDFTDYVDVTVQAQSVGDQLNVDGDVRMNGALVGRVSAVDQTAWGATVHLQIYRADANRIPRDVVARILPTTLFGQKYVELLSPTRATPTDHLVDGSVVAQDRSKTAVELETALSDLYPLLTAIRPDQLSSTLGALAAGLQGRGADLRQVLTAAGHYLAGLNANTAVLEQDLTLLSAVAKNYSASMPSLLQLLQRAGVVSNVLSAEHLSAFINNVNGAATAGQALLAANQQNLADSLALTRPTAALLATYAPEIDCVIGGFLENQALSAAQVRDNSVHGYFTIGQQANGYSTKNQLKLGDTGVGPHCSGLPIAGVPYPAVTLHDGVKR